MQPSERFIAREPYFSVLADARYLSKNRTPSDEEDFFRSGERDVAELHDTIRQRVVFGFHPQNVLEYGCGIGRLAIPLARRAGHVTAVDSSPAMLAAAREKACGLANIEFVSVAEFRASSKRFDLITCFLVLQRQSRGEGMALLRELIDRLDDGGVLVAEMPFQRTQRRVVHWMRSHLPGVNAVVNLARSKPLDTPLFANEIYNIGEIATAIRNAGCGDPYLVYSKHGEADAVIVYARKRIRSDVPKAEAVIDVRELIARSSLDDLNRTAEEYFASLTDWNHHLAKPLSSIDDAPAMLINFAVLLQGLNLSPGDVVLDFGGGSGWLSRFLTQLGCRTIVLDVSSTALRIARDLYQRMPPIGTQPEPQFLHFDGQHIDLPDASVDRIVCFDAFHHAPNPDEVISEFARILKPGGVAGFAEPGPHHSKTPQSQFEMRTYGVVEADIDVDAIRRTALKVGFSDMKLAALNVPPFHVSADQYGDLLEGGPSLMQWAEVSRDFMRDVRVFFLTREGAAPLDSRHREGLACVIEAEALAPDRIRAVVTNTGRAKWLPSGVEPGAVNLGCHLYDQNGKLLRLDFVWADLTSDKRPIAPGESAETIITLPPLEKGDYEIEIDCVANRVGWFAQFGSKPARVAIHI